jgi:hypothetical protein
MAAFLLERMRHRSDPGGLFYAGLLIQVGVFAWIVHAVRARRHAVMPAP